MAASGIGKASAIKLADKDVDGLEKFQWEIRAVGVECFVTSLDVLKTSPRTHIVNIYSLFDLFSLPLQNAYNVSKYAVK